MNSVFSDTKTYIVGGTIRDLLLGRISNPDDIDVTCHADPDRLRETMQFDEDSMSRFRTEKYGTITVIPKSNESQQSCTYEVTPFRAEKGYSDNRHPDIVQRSDSLVSDSSRRDFTINALYWTQHATTVSTQTTGGLPSHDTLQHCIKQQLPIILHQENLLVLTNSDHIESFVTQGLVPKSIALLERSHNQWVQISSTQNVAIKQVLIDPQSGLLDLMYRTIKTVGDPAHRYQEDALRLMRGLRFANVLNLGLQDNALQNSGFDLEKRTREQLVINADRITSIASERHYQELRKVFCYDNPFGYIATLKVAGLLPYLFPALYSTIDNHQPTRHHALDTYSHTLMVLYHIQQINHDPLVKFAVLYHDVGKPEQYAFMEEAKAINPENPSREGFEHHAEISTRIAAEDFSNLSFPKQAIQKICRYIKWHHRPGEILDSKPIKRKQKIRKLMSEGGYQETLNLIDIAIADRLGQYNPLQPPAIHELETMKETVHELYEQEGRFTSKDLVIDGHRLMQTFGIDPGPQVGELLQRSFERVLGDIQSRNNKQTLENLISGFLK